VLRNLQDADLLFAAKNACSIHTQAGTYAKEFLTEMKRRFKEGKNVGKPYLGYKNFDNLCADKLEISSSSAQHTE